MNGSFREWVAEHRKQISTNPVRGLMHAAFTTYLGIWYTLTSRWPLGTHVYDEDWDLLVILDGCRVDVLKDVADDYDFIETINSRWSVGSHSHEWLAQTFSTDYLGEIQETAYVTGNGHTNDTFVEENYPPDETVPLCRPDWRIASTADFGQLDMLWETAHRGKLGVPPRAITDRTIEVGRESNPDRLITHYMQPHIPYIAGALAEDREPTDTEIEGWKGIESGAADYNEVWDLYKQNLRLVLDEVELLLQNVDADNVIITADHGNAFGEYTIHGHPEGMLLPCIKEVPWVESEASDDRTRDPETHSDTGQTDIQEHLADLGYM